MQAQPSKHTIKASVLDLLLGQTRYLRVKLGWVPQMYIMIQVQLQILGQTTSGRIVASEVWEALIFIRPIVLHNNWLHSTCILYTECNN